MISLSFLFFVHSFYLITISFSNFALILFTFFILLLSLFLSYFVLRLFNLFILLLSFFSFLVCYFFVHSFYLITIFFSILFFFFYIYFHFGSISTIILLRCIFEKYHYILQSSVPKMQILYDFKIQLSSFKRKLK